MGQSSDRTIHSQTCQVCRHLKPVDVEEAHVLPLLDRFPGLANWRSFRLGFSEDVIVLTASKGWQRRLLVVDRKTRCLRSAAGKPRFGGSWSTIDVQHLD